MQTKDTE